MYDLISFWLYHTVEKKSYYIATDVCSRKSATTFGDLPDCLAHKQNTVCEVLQAHA